MIRLTNNQKRILQCIYTKQLSRREISLYTGLTERTLFSNLSFLVESGYLVENKDPSFRKRYFYVCSEAGEELVIEEILVPKFQQMIHENPRYMLQKHVEMINEGK